MTFKEFLFKNYGIEESKVPFHFRKKIDLRSKKSMIDFLSNHNRYNTMNSWNQCTSYSNIVKIYDLKLTREQENKAFDLLDTEDGLYWPQEVLNYFDEYYNHEYQIGFNGRSSGYVVIYRGGKKRSDYKSICTSCGQRNFKSINDTGKTCGKCGKDTRVDRTFNEIFTKPGIDIDQNADFEEWEFYELKNRVELVSNFDLICDISRQELISVIDNAEIVEEEYTITKTKKVIKYE